MSRTLKRFLVRHLQGMFGLVFVFNTTFNNISVTLYIMAVSFLGGENHWH